MASLPVALGKLILWTFVAVSPYVVPNVPPEVQVLSAGASLYVGGSQIVDLLQTVYNEVAGHGNASLPELVQNGSAAIPTIHSDTGAIPSASLPKGNITTITVTRTVSGVNRSSLSDSLVNSEERNTDIPVNRPPLEDENYKTAEQLDPTLHNIPAPKDETVGNTLSVYMSTVWTGILHFLSFCEKRAKKIHSQTLSLLQTSLASIRGYINRSFLTFEDMCEHYGGRSVKEKIIEYSDRVQTWVGFKIVKYQMDVRNMGHLSWWINNLKIANSELKSDSTWIGAMLVTMYGLHILMRANFMTLYPLTTRQGRAQSTNKITYFTRKIIPGSVTRFFFRYGYYIPSYLVMCWSVLFISNQIDDDFAPWPPLLSWRSILHLVLSVILSDDIAYLLFSPPRIFQKFVPDRCRSMSSVLVAQVLYCLLGVALLRLPPKAWQPGLVTEFDVWIAMYVFSLEGMLAVKEAGTQQNTRRIGTSTIFGRMISSSCYKAACIITSDWYKTRKAFFTNPFAWFTPLVWIQAWIRKVLGKLQSKDEPEKPNDSEQIPAGRSTDETQSSDPPKPDVEKSGKPEEKEASSSSPSKPDVKKSGDTGKKEASPSPPPNAASEQKTPILSEGKGPDAAPERPPVQQATQPKEAPTSQEKLSNEPGDVDAGAIRHSEDSGEESTPDDKSGDESRDDDQGNRRAPPPGRKIKKPKSRLQNVPKKDNTSQAPKNGLDDEATADFENGLWEKMDRELSTPSGEDKDAIERGGGETNHEKAGNQSDSADSLYNFPNQKTSRRSPTPETPKPETPTRRRHPRVSSPFMPIKRPLAKTQKPSTPKTPTPTSAGPKEEWSADDLAKLNKTVGFDLGIPPSTPDKTHAPPLEKAKQTPQQPVASKERANPQSRIRPSTTNETQASPPDTVNKKPQEPDAHGKNDHNVQPSTPEKTRPLPSDRTTQSLQQPGSPKKDDDTGSQSSFDSLFDEPDSTKRKPQQPPAARDKGDAGIQPSTSDEARSQPSDSANQTPQESYAPKKGSDGVQPSTPQKTRPPPLNRTAQTPPQPDAPAKDDDTGSQSSYDSLFDEPSSTKKKTPKTDTP